MAREQVGSDKATDADIRRMIAVYYGMIAYADAQLRRLVDEMRRRGLMENTWVVISSDHGDYGGEKGLYMKGESLYECLLHVPLIIVPPDGMRWDRGSKVSGLVDHVDLFPTILGVAGVEVPEYTQGHDLVPWLQNGAREPLHEVLFSQVGNYLGGLGTTNPTGMPLAGRHPSLLQSARSTEFSYIRDPDYGDEAYDLRADPNELVTLIGRGQQEPSEVAELRRSVDRWEEECLRLRDELGIVPGYRGFDQ